MTRKVFLKNGNGAIKATLKDDLVAKATFKVITEDPGNVPREGIHLLRSKLEVVALKGHSRSGSVPDFKPAPEIFPDISGQQ